MLTIAQLEGLDVGVYGERAQAWRRVAQGLRDQAGELDGIIARTRDWTGMAAEAAQDRLHKHRRDIGDAAGVIAQAPPTLEQGGEELAAAKAMLADAFAQAREQGMTVSPDGTVTPPASVGVPGSPADPQVLGQRAEGIADQIYRALKVATEADEKTATELGLLTPAKQGFQPEPGGVSENTLPASAVPAPGTPPAEVTAWWKSLSAAQQRAAIYMYEDKIGNLDGIPADARHQANLIRLGRMRQSLMDRRDELQEHSIAPGAGEERRKLEVINGKLAGLQDISDQMSTDPTAAGAPMLLGLDPSGNGRAIVSFGNPDTAENISTNVPGMTSKLETMGGQMSDAARLRKRAELASPDDESTATIAWMGYEAPQNLPQAARESYAEDAKGDLRRFQDGLDATHHGPDARKTVIGHSYGTVVTGHAAQDQGLNTDELISIGSPGMGVDRANELHLDGVPHHQIGDHVHASVADNDVIDATNLPYQDPPENLGLGPQDHALEPSPFDVHGPQPADPGFGADTFHSDPGAANPLGGVSVEAHSQYWRPNSESLRRMADITVGKR